ncbi:MAG: hypothetical protein ABIH63_04150 [archaeon]
MVLRSLTNSIAFLGYCVGSTFEFFSIMGLPGRYLAVRNQGDFVVVKEVDKNGLPKKGTPEFRINRDTKVRLV